MLLSLLPGPRQADLFEEASARDGERLVEAARAVVRDEPAYRGLDVGLAVKVALVVGDVRAGRWDRMGAGEAGTVATILRRQTPPRAYEGSGGEWYGDGHPDDGPVEFAFPWHRQNLRKADRLGLATAHADLHEVEPVVAPVACSLWTPEGRIEVRRHDSGWLRPVLSPGLWTPLTVAGFRAAARDGTAWRDNPFLVRQLGNAPVFRLLDHAEPRPVSIRDEERVTEERNGCLTRAGQLHVIDGIVHVHTAAPRSANRRRPVLTDVSTRERGGTSALPACNGFLTFARSENSCRTGLKGLEKPHPEGSGSARHRTLAGHASGAGPCGPVPRPHRLARNRDPDEVRHVYRNHGKLGRAQVASILAGRFSLSLPALPLRPRHFLASPLSLVLGDTIGGPVG